jgi:hypothetical protein
MSLVLALAISTSAAQDSTESGDQPVQKLDLKAGMHPPKATYQPEAEYSPEARQKHIDGKCLISMVVGINGLPQDVHVIRCSDRLFAQPSMASTTKYKFRPATKADGNPVAVEIFVEVDFRIDGAREVVDPIRSGFATPPGVTSSEPDTNGIYPLTKIETAPTFVMYKDQGYGTLAFSAKGRSVCEVILTIDVKGKPSHPAIYHCDRDGLAEPAMKSLLASKYKPAIKNGEPVSVRALVHLEYGDFPDTN